MTTSAATPASAHSRATSGTLSAGTATIARSTSPAMSLIVGAARREPMKSAFGLTGYSSPRKPLSSTCRKAAPPNASGRRDAPITATERGLSTRSTAATAAVRSRSSNLRRASSPSSVGNSSSIPSGEARTCDREARLAEDADHAPVLRQHGRGEGRDAAGAGDLREVRDQDRGQAAALHLVGDRERHLGAVGALELEDGVGDDALLGAGGDDQPVALGAVAARRDLGGAIEVDAEREVAQPARVLAQPAEELAQRGRVGRARPAARARSSRRAARCGRRRRRARSLRKRTSRRHGLPARESIPRAPPSKPARCAAPRPARCRRTGSGRQARSPARARTSRVATRGRTRAADVLEVVTGADAMRSRFAQLQHQRRRGAAGDRQAALHDPGGGERGHRARGAATRRALPRRLRPHVAHRAHAAAHDRERSRRRARTPACRPRSR